MTRDFHGHVATRRSTGYWRRPGCCLPSLKEGWGLVVVEAGMHGRRPSPTGARAAWRLDRGRRHGAARRPARGRARGRGVRRHVGVVPGEDPVSRAVTARIAAGTPPGTGPGGRGCALGRRREAHRVPDPLTDRPSAERQVVRDGPRSASSSWPARGRPRPRRPCDLHLGVGGDVCHLGSRSSCVSSWQASGGGAPDWYSPRHASRSRIASVVGCRHPARRSWPSSEGSR